MVNIIQKYAVLNAETAEALMTPNPVSIHAYALVQEAVQLLNDTKLTAIPVVNEEGSPIGVISQTDIILYHNQQVGEADDTMPISDYYEPTDDGEHDAIPDYYEQVDLNTDTSQLEGFQLQKMDLTKINEIMTPVVFSVTPQTSAMQVINEMLVRKIHRMFVIDQKNVLVGVVSAMDVLRNLQ